MEKVKQAILKLSIVLISVYSMDGGASISLVSNNIQIIFSHRSLEDIEFEHQYHHSNLTEDLKQMESFMFDFSLYNLNPVRILFAINPEPLEFPDLIWQPPKLV